MINLYDLFNDYIHAVIVNLIGDMFVSKAVY